MSVKSANSERGLVTVRSALGVLILAGPACAVAGLTIEDDVAAAGVSNPIAQIKVTKAELWQAAAGSSLRAELQRWADSARWTVVYETSIDYPLLADLQFQGRFDQVVGEFVRLYELSDRPLVVDISLNQRLVHVTERQRR